MGLFSSRKTSVETDNYHVTATTLIGTAGGGAAGAGGLSAGEKSVVKVIRSRFYGKKGKEREAPITYIPQPASVAQTLAIGSAATVHTPVASSPLAGNSKTGRIKSKRVPPPTTPVTPSISLRISTQDERTLPPTPSTQKRVGRDSDFAHAIPSPITPAKDRGEGRVKIMGARPSMSAPVTPVSTRGADAITTTLAQRLNELAVANADGLLNDDEYRILRQNLFERFTSASEVPSESPLVPAMRSRQTPTGSSPSSPDRAPSRPMSNFQVELPRPPSSQSSRLSITSGVASLFRRTSTSMPLKDSTDAASVWSQQSEQSSRWKLTRVLSRKSSNSSMRTTASKRDKAETMSISSRRERGATSASRPETPHRRKLATPPSAFPGTLKHQENRYPNNNSIYNVFNEDHLSTTAEIRQEIAAVEAEVKRLMDAFTGLEVTTLSRTQRSRGYSITRSETPGRPSNVGSIVESKRRFNISESDAGSILSANTTGTGPSKSASSARMGIRAKASITTSLALSATSSRPGSLRRKNSSSSMQSHGVPKMPPVPAVPLPALPSNHGNFGAMNGANNSSVSLARSAHVMQVVPEDDTRSAADTVTTTIRLDEEMEDESDEMQDIRRRREEVQQRYDARLDYLRAKLKSAVLHEKLLRR